MKGYLSQKQGTHKMQDLDLSQIPIDKELTICHDFETGRFEKCDDNSFGQIYKGEYHYPSGTKYIKKFSK